MLEEPKNTPSNAADALPLVVMIEPEIDKAFATRLTGETEGLWTTEVATTPAELLALKNSGLVPACIGFHASKAKLPNGRTWNPEPFHQALNSTSWSSITVLVSAGLDGNLDGLTKLAKRKAYEGAVARNGWVAYLRQRVTRTADQGTIHDDVDVLARLRDRILQSIGHRSKEPLHESLNLGDFANRLGPAVVVLQEPQPGQAPQQIAQNRQAEQHPWGSQDLRRWTWLRAQLEAFRRKYPPAVQARAHLLDWDGEEGLPVECRLYDLGSGAFWYTRDWRADHAQAIDDVFAHIEAKRSLADRFDGLASYLAQRWSISRLRLFEVAALPEGQGDIGGDTRGQWVSFEPQPGQKPAFLVVPRYQSGLGWPNAAREDLASTSQVGSNATIQPADWWGKRFTWAEFVDGKSELPPPRRGKKAWLKRADVEPRVFNARGHNYIFELMNQPCKVSQAVDWGTCKQRLLVLVPDARQSAVGNEQPPAPRLPLVAMLAMDRRADHLLGNAKKLFRKDEEERLRLLHDGVIGEDIDADVVDSMNHGALNAVRDRVGQWLADARQERARMWDARIQREIAQTAGQGQGMAALSKLCDALLKAWPQLWQAERERLALNVGEAASLPKVPHLTQLFFVTPVSQTRVTMPAGSGVAWQRYKQQPAWPLVSPFAELLGATPDPARGDCMVIQDLQLWLRTLPRMNREFAAAEAECLAATSSWVAIRLPAAQGVAPVLLVAHFGGEPRQIWLEVLQLLHRTAHHLRAPFLLAWSEARERAVWASSVAHEMKNMALLGLFDARHNPGSTMLIERLQQQVNLAEDFLFSLRPDLSPDEELTAKVEHVNVAAMVTSSMAWWHEERPQVGEGEVQWAPGADYASVPLVGAQAWQRVVRVLLHNAFRHGEGEVKVAGALVKAGPNAGPPSLRLTVENLASQTSLSLLRQTANPSVAQLPSAFVRRHIGLQTARALCERVGARLVLTPERDRVTVTLDWPMTGATTAQ